MEKLTLEHIAPYLPYGLKATTKEVKYINARIGVVNSWQGNGNEDEQIVISTKVGYYLSSISNTIPILRPMDLTKPITVDGNEVIPIVELAKMCTQFTDWEIKEGLCVTYSEGITQPKYWQFYFDNNSFILYWEESRGHYVPTYNQLALFKKLYEWKFDVDGLIEKGLAIDVKTLETNPYSS